MNIIQYLVPLYSSLSCRPNALLRRAWSCVDYVLPKLFPHINNVFELQQNRNRKVTQYGCLLKGNFWGSTQVRLTCRFLHLYDLLLCLLLFILFNYLFYSINTVNFVKSYLFVECTSFVSARAPNKDTKRYCLFLHTTMASSLSVQHLYEYSVLSSFEVTSKESFLQTVNNGKALCMTVHVRSF